MVKFNSSLAATLLLGASMVALANAAPATPFSSMLAMRDAAANNIASVRWQRARIGKNSCGVAWGWSGAGWGYRGPGGGRGWACGGWGWRGVGPYVAPTYVSGPLPRASFGAKSDNEGTPAEDVDENRLL
jgi:hypothetical protein